MTDFKKKAAEFAVGMLVRNSIIGLGAGGTVKHLVDYINAELALKNSIQVVTSSYTTKILLKQYGFNILEAEHLQQIAIYLDGCDQVDASLNALKSGGGIHFREKLLAMMATEFIIMADESKYMKELDATHPLVIEVVPIALTFVLSRLKQLYSKASLLIRMNDQKDGPVITEQGNYLINVYFEKLPPLMEMNDIVSAIPGVLSHSLFYQLAQKAIIAGADGVRTIVSK